MKYSYYPGCTLRNKAKDLDVYARASAQALGFELEEIENWQCCGGVYPLASDEIASKLSSVRALNEAGYRTRNGKEFVISTVQSIWNNEQTYRGMYRYGNGDWVKGQHEAILTD